MRIDTLSLLAATIVAGTTTAASAADLPVKAPPAAIAPAASWTGFYVFGGGGGGLWAADGSAESTGILGAFGPDIAALGAGTTIARNERLGGSGWFGTVGLGYDWQFGGRWVAGVFADGQFGNIRGSLFDSFAEGRETLRTSYAAGARLGWLVAPNVLSYVNAGYSGSEWSGSSMSDNTTVGSATILTTRSFHRDGVFVGGGVENDLNMFGISAPGWFMKTEYRSAFYNRVNLLADCTIACGAAGPSGTAVNFKPWVQTVSAALVYRFNATGPADAASASAFAFAGRPDVKPVANWSGVYVFGGGGGGLWAADNSVESNGLAGGFPANGPAGTPLTNNLRLGGRGWFGTAGLGYDWQFNRWLAGVFADGQFGEIRGSLNNNNFLAVGDETLRTSYAAGVRLGWLVAPNVLSYANAGYSGSEWSGSSLLAVLPVFRPSTVLMTTPSFHRDGFFVGGGVENSFDIFGIHAAGWTMKTEYRSAFYDRATLSPSCTAAGCGGVAGTTGTNILFKPWVQTISTALVYRFN